MKFRYARHTTDLNCIIAFYTEIAGLKRLGGFNDHSGYDGVFLGFDNMDWHLEFTVSNYKSQSTFDEDDALVFYVTSKEELEQKRNLLLKKEVELLKPKNPYWEENGIMICDPDGFRIIFSIKDYELNSQDKLTLSLKNYNISKWSELLAYIKKIPYGRNSARSNFSLILEENKGTCSSKHAFVKTIADLNKLDNIKLILGIYKMNHQNTPKIHDTLLQHNLEYLPEAHCYLKINNIRIDITHTNSDLSKLENDIIHELDIEANQVIDFKIKYHQQYLKDWLKTKNHSLNFDEIWEIREECIKKLET